jgi:putative phage-type endonuclease
MATREQWLAERRLGIGGSDAAAVLGLSPWKTNVELWEEKAGRREERDISDDPYVQYGVAAEPLIRSMFAIDYPQYTVSHEENVSEVCEAYPQLRASLDGRLVEAETNRVGVLEIKASFINSRADREKWKDAVPQHYFIQVLHNMFVVNADFAVLKARLVSDWESGLWITEKSYHFERADHTEDIQFLIEKELAFWRLVETDTRPDLILPEI